jgi:hypothetical protein
MWLDHAERDRRNPQLLGKDATYHTYDELLAVADPAVEEQLAPSVWEQKYQRGQEAVEALSVALAKASPDIAIVIGDDQREMFTDDGIPAFACFTGSELVDMLPDEAVLQRIPKGIRAAYWAVHADQPAIHPVALELSAHVAEQLAWDDFDLTVVRRSRRAHLGARVHLPQVPARAAAQHADRAGLREHLLPAERAVRDAVLPARQGAAPCCGVLA